MKNSSKEKNTNKLKNQINFMKINFQIFNKQKDLQNIKKSISNLNNSFEKETTYFFWLFSTWQWTIKWPKLTKNSLFHLNHLNLLSYWILKATLFVLLEKSLKKIWMSRSKVISKTLFLWTPRQWEGTQNLKVCHLFLKKIE